MTLQDVRLHLVDDVDTAFELMRWLSTKDRIGFDVEATGLNRQHDKVRLVQVGDAHDGWAIPWDRWGGVVEELVRRYTGDYVIHNLTYDHVITENSCGIRLPPNKCHDTRVAAHVLHPTRSTALKSLCAYYVDPTAAGLGRQLDDVLSKRNGWTWATVPVTYEPYWTYGALDPVLNIQLDDVLRPKVMAEAPRAYDLELAVSWVCIAMSQRGSHIDREYTQERLDAFHKYTVDCERWCMEHYGVKPGQNASIVEVLRAAGYTFTKETEAGAVCLDKEVLSPIDHPLAQTVLSRRQVQKVASTYLRNFLQYADDEDNIHPNINPLGFKQEKLDEATFGVRTGRMSMDHPNFQNLPRKGTSGAGDSVRSCVIARPGHTLLMVDFDQIEARLIAHLTEDPGFIAAFSEGDFFVNVVRELWDDPTVEKSDPRRQSTKNGIYARSYGAGPDKFAKTTGITVEAAYAFYQRLDQVYPGWQALTRNLERTARQRLDDEGTAYVRSPLTRRKHTADGDKLYVLMNYLIQGTASEVLKMKLVDMSHAGLDEFMTLPVHDEMICDVPDEDLLDVAHTAVSIMSAPVYDLFDQPLKVPLTASASKGQRWGSKTDL